MTDSIDPTTYTALGKSILGQKVTIPSIYNTFPNWNPRQHPDHGRAREEALNPWIQRWVIDQRTARTLETADFGSFAAVWCQDAPFDILCTAVKYFAWYFVYDDLFDCGALKHDEILATKYKAASHHYFKCSLLGEGEKPDLTCFDIDLRNGLQCWDEIGEHIREVCSKSTREVLYDEMSRYIGSLNNVDINFAVHEIPTVEEYWDRREATAGAHCVIATLPFIYGVDVDRADFQDRSMRDLWRHTSHFVHITNDMLSFRKEINDGQIENLITVLMLNDQIDCSTAMTRCYQLLHNEATSFRDAGAYLVQKHQGRSRLISDIFIKGCLNVAMGLAHWSYLGDRYFKAWERDENNVISFTVTPRKFQEQRVA